MLQVLQKAPEFKGEAVVGSGDFKNIALQDFKGKYVILFFYPMDFTFVCPTEIQEFSRRAGDFEKEDAQVIGVSVDSKYSHRAWIQNGLGELRFPLLADFSKAISRDYGALLEEKAHST